MSDGPLSGLLRGLSAGGTSYRVIATKAIDPETGEQLDHRYINDIARGQLVTPPPPARLRALAAGIEIPVDTLKKLAAVQWLDLDVDIQHPHDGEWVLWSTVHQLPPEDQQAIQNLAEHLLNRNRKHHGDDHAE